MNYDLALKLKNAGFPIHKFTINDIECSVCNEKPYELDYQNHTSEGCIPTLSELIEACGSEFVALVRWEVDLWTASNCERDTPMVHRGMEIKTDGSTPEEAGANLWLALNKQERK